MLLRYRGSEGINITRAILEVSCAIVERQA